jgi:flagellar biosynthetic protein FlhB
MAHDDRTEKPTPKRKREARRKGQVAKSPDVSAWLIMLAATVLVPQLLGSAGKRLEQLWAQVANVITDPTQAGAIGVLNQGLNDAAALILPTVGACAVIGVFANVAQTGLMLSGHNAAPKWDRLNPLAGVKRLLSTQSLWELSKQAVKLVTLVGVAYGALSGLAHTLVGVQPVNMTPVVAYTGAAIMSLIQKVAALGLVLALADYAWSKRKLNKSLKMTKHEVKEEARQSDGDPHLKGQVRRRMYKLSRARMMAAVAGADVVVVNPTHFAVALRYERERGGAPIVVAKGADELALRIREEGQKHRVPVVEDPPLARAVYAACDIDDAIPAELFLAVARLLAFVFTLNPILRAAGLVHRRPISALVA